MTEMKSVLTSHQLALVRYGIGRSAGVSPQGADIGRSVVEAPLLIDKAANH
jgi:hypothetical protein